MKKIYSLLMAVICATLFNAQGTENYDTRALTTGNSYTTSSFNGLDATVWHLEDGRMVDTTSNVTISGITTIIKEGAGGQTITFSNGVGTLNFQYKKAFTGGTTRTIELYVNGTKVDETSGFGTGSGGQSTIYNYSYTINDANSVTVKIMATGAQVSIDNFSWTAANPLSVEDFRKEKITFIKNTNIKNDVIVFGAEAKDIKIYTLSGALVKVDSLKTGSVLNIADLAKGNYIVTGTVHNKPISQKILKD